MSVRRSRRQTSITQGGRTVTKSNVLTMQADELARHFAPEVSKIMDDTLDEINTAGLAKWPRPGKAHPRSTGRSYKLMKHNRAHLTSAFVIKASIDNPARNPRDNFAYVYVIRTKKSKGKPIWQQYYVKPFKKRTEALLDEMIDAMQRIGQVT